MFKENDGAGQDKIRRFSLIRLRRLREDRPGSDSAIVCDADVPYPAAPRPSQRPLPPQYLTGEMRNTSPSYTTLRRRFLPRLLPLRAWLPSAYVSQYLVRLARVTSYLPQYLPSFVLLIYHLPCLLIAVPDVHLPL